MFRIIEKLKFNRMKASSYSKESITDHSNTGRYLLFYYLSERVHGSVLTLAVIIGSSDLATWPSSDNCEDII